MNDTLRNKSVRLSPDQIAALEDYAQKDKRDVSSVIRIAIDEFFDREKEKLPNPMAREAVAA